MLDVHGGASPLDDLQPVAHAHEIVKLIDAVRAVHVADSVRRYAVDLVAATRSHPDLRLGASPRATLHLLRAAKASAALWRPGLRPAGRRPGAGRAGAGAPAAAHRAGPVEPPYRRAGRRWRSCSARPCPTVRRRRRSDAPDGYGQQTPRGYCPASAGAARPARRRAVMHRPAADRAARRTAQSGGATQARGLRTALGGLTTRGRSFLAAGRRRRDLRVRPRAGRSAAGRAAARRAAAGLRAGAVPHPLPGRGQPPALPGPGARGLRGAGASADGQRLAAAHRTADAPGPGAVRAGAAAPLRPGPGRGGRPARGVLPGPLRPARAAIRWARCSCG